MPENNKSVGFKRNKGNPPIYGGKFASIYFKVYKNRNVKNVPYFVLSFAHLMGPGRWANFNVRMDEIANMQQALDAARLWLRRNA